MNLRIPILLAGVVFAAGAAASPASPYPMDCTKWKDAARCAGFNDKIAACRDKTDDAWLGCMYPGERPAAFTPPKARDCSHASNKALCETHAAALDACKDAHTRAEHRDCMAGRMQAMSSKGR